MNKINQMKSSNGRIQCGFNPRIWIFVFLFFVSFALNAQDSRSEKGRHYEVSGTILEEAGSKKTQGLEFATVSIPDYSMATSTNKNGNFTFKSVPSGKVHLQVKFIGKMEIDTVISVNKNVQLTLLMSDENFRLVEVVVTATNSKAGQATASKISRNAIDHLQATSLDNILSLLPGGITSNQDLNNAKQANIRNASTNASSMNAFGVSIIKDGAPISNNANLQAMNPTVAGSTNTLSGGTPPSGGVDLRLVSTDNIESVEVIRGIPSVQYGDLTSGAIIINSKAGKEPLRVRAKANPNTYEFSAGYGFHLGEKKGSLNIGGDYANNVNNPVQSYRTYERSNLKFLYSNVFFDRLKSNTTLDFIYGRDRQALNPDEQITKTQSKGDNLGVSFNTNGTLTLNKSWITNIRYTGSVSYMSKQSYMSQQYTAATSPYSMTTTDGAILSNKPGMDVWDASGNKITNDKESNKSLYAMELPSTYVGRYDIDGKEINAFAQLTGHLYKRLGQTNHAWMAGIDFKTDGNNGDGKTFNSENPPYRNLQAVNASFRPRSYKDIPFINQLGLYAQENFRYSFLKRELNVTAGLRYDYISVVKDALSPRINASFEILPDMFTIRGGYGITAKAPSAMMLYPEQAYFEYVNINELSNQSIPQNDRMLITTTRVFDTQNKDIKIAKNTKKEIGFDLKISQAVLAVTAFREKLQNGYFMSVTVNSFQPLLYNQYIRTTEGLVLSESNPVLAKYYTPTNNLQSESRGIEFDLNLGRFNAIRTAFSVNGMWVQSQNYSSDYTYFDDNSGTSGSSRTHIGMYEKGMSKNKEELFTTTLRATHNIPEIGFVVTLTAQAIWNDSQWYLFGNDSIPVKYLSKNDGMVYDFDPAKKNDPEYSLLLRRVQERNYIKEQYPSAFTFNINVTKELGDYMRVSFFANNMFRSYPSVRSQRTPESYLIRKQKIFFGVELSLTL